jgi:hypothetical protein
MALMLGKVQDALRAANVPKETARGAAEKIATSEISTRELRRTVDEAIAGLRTEVRVGQAVTGLIVVLILATLWQLFTLRGEVSTIRSDVSSVRGEVRTLDTKLEFVARAVERIEAQLGRLQGGRLEQPAGAPPRAAEPSP